MQYKNLDRFFFRFVTIHVFDGQTDIQMDTFLATRPPCIQCSAVKTIQQQNIMQKLNSFKVMLLSLSAPKHALLSRVQ